MKKHIVMPKRTKKCIGKKSKVDYTEECKLIHSNGIIFAEQSIRYMFYSNAGAITYVLLRFNLEKFFIPLLVFSCGIAYTILISLYMYTRSTSSVIVFLTNATNPLLYWHKSRFYRPVCLFFMYLPMVVFLYGIYCTGCVVTGGKILSPFQILIVIWKSII